MNNEPPAAPGVHTNKQFSLKQLSNAGPKCNSGLYAAPLCGLFLCRSAVVLRVRGNGRLSFALIMPRFLVVRLAVFWHIILHSIVYSIITVLHCKYVK
jgi:hypothetical protein